MLALRICAIALVLAAGGCMSLPRGMAYMDDGSVMLNFEPSVALGAIAADADVGDYINRVGQEAESEGGPHGVTYMVNAMPQRLVRVMRTKNGRAMTFYYTVVEIPSGANRRLQLQPVVAWQDSLGGDRLNAVAVADAAPVLKLMKEDFERFATKVRPAIP